MLLDPLLTVVGCNAWYRIAEVKALPVWHQRILHPMDGALGATHVHHQVLLLGPFSTSVDCEAQHGAVHKADLGFGLNPRSN